uniref:Methyltransferase type 11 domain-containing protein n=1 Tax=Chromera velia CCMP2878 TaxID=1169474 RepID=A0A0G4HFR5_9ALVE|mmetsp:Transcript_16464/g.33505  ORF Transcript_16464/g.33505 Transcript_16464/m.33505 type:complete len:353 (-) Transcript_16464:133-1191(-)|eukprot:Cvel_27165.t1-p1 / transcript=Cvel_27165.t1 / gene=Cvel_27165 / organism=Chromera_velia_CCMP2878 / gene_product=hypothetical protein / transcript_product=hypothetical protein / location=Cvel_scaffold3346:2161-4380(-) / protein_length=352 / sequence_SO=supercontig / SO=protein_coding / is_pseudo=false
MRALVFLLCLGRGLGFSFIRWQEAFLKDVPKSLLRSEPSEDEVKQTPPLSRRDGFVSSSRLLAAAALPSLSLSLPPTAQAEETVTLTLEAEPLEDFLEQFDEKKVDKFRILQRVVYPAEWPFDDSIDFLRIDRKDDKEFYEEPRFVQHIDEFARSSLTSFYKQEFPQDGFSNINATNRIAHLDLCSSWVSHFPDFYQPRKVVGVGMNGNELRANRVLTDYVVQNLNLNPKLEGPLFADESYDVITNALSVDYLTKPREVFKEMYRLLKPGGVAILGFSNRCFFTKAVRCWLKSTDYQRCGIAALYFKFGGFKDIQASDIGEESRFQKVDPMYVVWARKPGPNAKNSELLRIF